MNLILMLVKKDWFIQSEMEIKQTELNPDTVGIGGWIGNTF